MKKLAVILLVVLLVGCIHYRNDWGRGSVSQIESMLMRIRVTADVLYAGTTTPQAEETGGVCWPIGGGYIIALTHATDIPETMVVYFPWGPSIIERKVTNLKFILGDKDVKLIGRVDDISIFYHEDYQDAIPARWGDSDKVKLGDRVLIVGSSYHIGYNIKDGVISILKPSDSRLRNVQDNTFMISAPVNPGDSGSPMLAKIGNNLEIIGVVNAGIPQTQGLNFALRGNYVKDCIHKITGKKPWIRWEPIGPEGR